MKSSLGYGFIHPIYQPVYHTYYREVKDKEYEFIIHSKGQNTETELLKRCCNAAVLNLEEINLTVEKLAGGEREIKLEVEDWISEITTREVINKLENKEVI